MSLADYRAPLRAFLLADSAIAAVVVAGGKARIWHVRMPQDERRPSLVFVEVTNLGDHHMQGPSGLSRPRLQITAWAADTDAARALALLVKERLDGFRGTMTTADSPPQSIAVQGAFFDSGRDLYDAVAKMFGRADDYFLWFGER